MQPQIASGEPFPLFAAALQNEQKHLVLKKTPSLSLHLSAVDSFNGAVIPFETHPTEDQFVIVVHGTAKITVEAPLHTEYMTPTERLMSVACSSFQGKNLYKAIATCPKHRILAAAVEAAGLVNVLSNSALTIFAPNDEAFTKMGITLANVASVPNLAAILKNHVYAPAVLNAKQLYAMVQEQPGRKLAMLGGSQYALNVDAVGRLYVGDSEVVHADKMATNGVIHEIDAVLMPNAAPAPSMALGLQTPKRTHTVSPGELFIIEAGRRHKIEQIGDEPLKLISVYSKK